MCTSDKSKGLKGRVCARMGLAAHNKFYFPTVQGKAIPLHLMLDFMIL